MGDPIITNVDIGNIFIRGIEIRDDILTFGGAGTILEGTILARDSSSDKLIPYVKGGTTNDDGIPKVVISYPVTASGAGDVSVRVVVAGVVRKQRLVIDADGDSSNIDSVVIDELRDYANIAIDVEELGILDNQ